MIAATPELLRLVANTLTAYPYEAWNFGDSVGFEGMVASSDLLGDPRWLGFAHGFIRGWAAEGRPHRRLDCTAAGLAMVEVYERTNDALVLEAAQGLARYLLARPTLDGVFATWERSPLMHPYGPATLSPEEAALVDAPPPGVFIDCLHFDPPFFTALGAVTGEQDLVDAGVEQALGYVRLLQAEDGSFDHFLLDGSSRTYGPRWGRGQGWALLGLLDVIARLEPTSSGRDPLVVASQRLIAVMRATQREDGHWDAVVGDAASGLETSTAAFMADGFKRAVRLGVADDPELVEASRRALAAALSDTDKAGVLADVSAAVMACMEPSHYAHVPRGFVVPWGQGPLAMALAEHLREGA
jgi:unsaturated rhamnogalacturonyl hydrolase